MTITTTTSGRYRFGPATSTPAAGAPKRTKAQAWRMCVAQGALLGVPEHGWRKCHTRHGWAWYSLSKAQEATP